MEGVLVLGVGTKP
ncbi:unnamed protein product [Linum tenue]|uniref:Uncharacterized protein n=1 Tax=Linum tenue TaxID=586396 RepID=A0AAV0S0R8_9ROSI|nr:unnamed protein product [Linum tenue]